MGFLAYKITCLANGKSYIGITKRSIKARWSDHCEAAAIGGRRHRLAAAMRKYGVEQFEIHPIACALTIDALYDLERELIAQEGTIIPAGYNMTSGGNGPARLTPSPEAIAKTAAANRGRKFPPRSAEWSAKIAAKARGRKWTPGMREKMEGRFKGRVFTPEWKAKISAAKKGQGPSPEQARAHSAKTKGVKKPPRTAEHCAKLAANAKSQWARLRSVDPDAMRLS